MKKENIILILSISASLFLLILSIINQLYKVYWLFSIILIIAFLVGTLPYFLYRYLKFREYELIKNNYSRFLEDLAEAMASGMTIIQALKYLEKNNYGPLNKYLRKLNIWLSWNIPFPRAFKKYNDLLKEIEIVNNANQIILEAYRFGGDIIKVLKEAAKNIETLSSLEKERESYVKQQVLIVYVIFFLFVGILVILKKILAPMVALQQLASTGFLKIGSISLKELKPIFFLAMIIEGLFAGIIAGVVEKGKIVQGFKHALIMLFIALVVGLTFILPPEITIDIPTVIKGYSNTPLKISGRISVDGSPVRNTLVTVKVGYLTKSTYTDAQGKFTIEFVLPKGKYTGMVITTVENTKVEKKFVVTIE